jgi:hypothetical protein
VVFEHGRRVRYARGSSPPPATVSAEAERTPTRARGQTGGCCRRPAAPQSA